MRPRRAAARDLWPCVGAWVGVLALSGVTFRGVVACEHEGKTYAVSYVVFGHGRCLHPTTREPMALKVEVTYINEQGCSEQQPVFLRCRKEFRPDPSGQGKGGVSHVLRPRTRG